MVVVLDLMVVVGNLQWVSRMKKERSESERESVCVRVLVCMEL